MRIHHRAVHSVCSAFLYYFQTVKPDILVELILELILIFYEVLQVQYYSLYKDIIDNESVSKLFYC